MDEFESWIKEILPDYIERRKFVEDDGVVNMKLTIPDALLFMGMDAAGVVTLKDNSKEMKKLHLVARKNWKELADRLFHMNDDELYELAASLLGLTA